MDNLNTKIQNMPKEVKSSVAFAFASFISTGISYLTTPIFTRLLSVSEYGQVNVFLTWQSLFAIIALFSLHYGVFNNGMMDYKDKRDEYSFSLLVLSNTITFVFGLFLMLIIFIFPSIFTISIRFLFIMLVVFFVQPAYNFWLARQRYEYQYIPALKASVLIAIITPLISIICVVFFKNNRIDSRIFGLEIPLFFIYLYFYINLGKKAKWKVNREYWREAFLFNLPLLPHYLSTYLLSSSDKLMIAKIVGDYATGYYSVAYAIASLGLIVWTAINGSLIPYTYDCLKNGEFSKLSKLISKILFVVLACSFGVIIIAPEVLKFLASSTYFSCLSVIPVIVGGVFFQVHYSIYANVLFYYRKPKYVMFASVCATILNLIANYIFINKYGYLAAGYTTLFCYLIQAAIDYLALRVVVKENIYNMIEIGVMSFVCLLFSFFGNYIYGYPCLRYLILITTILFFIFFRKKVYVMIKNIL